MALITARTKVITDVSQLNNFQKGDILVTHNTDNNFVDAMRMASGIITEKTGIRSHAAQIGLAFRYSCYCWG